jgi:hypothetical protein
MIFRKTVFILISIISVISSQDEVEVPADRGLNWYESLPAVAMDYKVHIDAGEVSKFPVKSFDVFNYLHVLCNSQEKRIATINM